MLLQPRLFFFFKEQEFSSLFTYNFRKKTTLRGGKISRIAVEIEDLKKNWKMLSRMLRMQENYYAVVIEEESGNQNSKLSSLTIFMSCFELLLSRIKRGLKICVVFPLFFI